ncbi:MAG: hypothetical protein IKU19_06530 [Clostridia bacterium]|nr:hypothetical protein [Clostridia bacterium]
MDPSIQYAPMTVPTKRITAIRITKTDLMGFANLESRERLSFFAVGKFTWEKVLEILLKVVRIGFSELC